MLQLTDIKITHKNSPEPLLAPQAPKASADNSSAASFFSILTSQLGSTGQAAETTAHPDQMKTGARAESAEKESAPRETARTKERGEEAARAERDDAERAHKEPSQELSTREAKPAEAPKPVAEKRPADALQNKNLVENTEPSARPARTQRAKKADDADMRELFDGLHRIMDIIKGKDQPEFRASKAGGREADLLEGGSRGRAERNPLQGLLDRLTALMKKIEAKGMPADQADRLGSLVAGMKDLAQKARHGQDRGRAQMVPAAAEPAVTAVKDLLVRIEALLETAKGEGSQNRPGTEARGNSDLFSFNHFKSDMQARSADTAAAHQKQAPFMEHMNHIIDNAKVVVRDSRNGSFSVRLYPRELGSMNVSLGLENGIVHGTFLVESPEAKDLLTSSLDQIRQRLADAGIAVGEFRVDVNDRRGRRPGDAESEESYTIAPAQDREEIAVEYESNAKPYHDGHINLVI